VGELYLEFHRGTLTTQARTKQLNRVGEHRLLEAEAFATIAQLSGFPYPHDEIETAWKTLLLNQFHDIIPGSSIAEVYQDTVPELEEACAPRRSFAMRRLAHLGGRDGPLGDHSSSPMRPAPRHDGLLAGQDGD
jgi:alpha-mannosidase